MDLLKREWKQLFEKLGYNDVANFSVIHQELENAKEYLLKEAKQLHLIRDNRGIGVKQFNFDAIIERN